MSWFAQAPANIALIKYMGKKDFEKNIPDNSSLSYTLTHLLSSVRLESITGHHDVWEPLESLGAQPFQLSIAAQTRFLQHFSYLKSCFNETGSFLIRSNNNFPHSSGLASSASSFAALTKCAVLAFSERAQIPCFSVEQQAALSRKGSGSSCRSFFTPWALWTHETVEAIDLPYPVLHHEVILIDTQEKKVSSSMAHQRIATSPLYALRHERVEPRLKAVLHAFKTQNWAKACQLCWQEFEEMHQLFSTCADPFSYFTDDTRNILNLLQDFWQHKGDGPLVTMDAGPNIHLLYRMDQTELAQQFKVDYLSGHYDIL
jgi:diphosphomevalonate decarboxylase